MRVRTQKAISVRLDFATLTDLDKYCEKENVRRNSVINKFLKERLEQLKQ